VECRLESDEAAFSLASINGEAAPRVFRGGQRVPAGAVNVGRAEVRLVARQPWADSLLAQLMQAGDRPGERHLLLERIVRGYVAGILIVATLAGVGWWLGSGDALRTWAVVTAILVVSCPCAVALAFPLADEMATVALRRRGVFVREGDLWPKIARIRQVIFDKTGTLTLENPVLQNPKVLATLDPAARRALFDLVSDNPHPVSQCLHENLLAAGPIDPAPAGGETEVRETVGLGVELGPWSLGRPGWRSTSPAPCHLIGDTTASDSPLGAPASQKSCHLLGDATAVGSPGGEAASQASCHLLGDTKHAGHDAELVHAGRVVARFHFVDSARPDARVEVQALAARGLAIGILSGDRAEKVASLAGELGLAPERALGGLSPQAKADWLSAHGADQTLMLGDGANDSLAFDRALARGTPVIHRGVLERKADFYYLGRGIGGLRALFEVDAIRRRTQLAILIFSIVYNVLAVGMAIAGRMNPLVAAIMMPINSLLTLAIVTSGMRAAFRRPG
jgi:Cu2+-exporting ATPase